MFALLTKYITLQMRFFSIYIFDLSFQYFFLNLFKNQNYFNLYLQIIYNTNNKINNFSKIDNFLKPDLKL